MLLHFLFCLSAQPNSLGVRPIRCYHISFALPKQIEPNKSFVYLVFGLDHFDPPVLILFHRGLQQVPVCLCKHCCCGYFRGANFHVRAYLRHQVRHWDNLHDSTEENVVMKQATKREKKITKTLLIVLLLFLACYVPSCVCIYIVNFCYTCGCEFIHWVRDIQFVLVMANSGMNPFVYAWRLKNFRKAFKSILTCRAFLRRLRSVSVNLQLSTVRTVNNTVSSDGSIGRVNPTVQE